MKKKTSCQPTVSKRSSFPDSLVFYCKLKEMATNTHYPNVTTKQPGTTGVRTAVLRLAKAVESEPLSAL
jgi:hypothetical protein